MSIWKTAIACSLATAVVAGHVGQATAAPLPTNVATMKAAAGDEVTPVYWRGRGFGWALGGLAAGAIIGGAIASGGPYGYYDGGPYYDYPGYGYGYAPAYYGYGPAYAYPGYGYRRYYRPYRSYYGYYRPYRPYYGGYW